MRTEPRILPFWWMGWIALMLLVFALPSLAARLVLLSGDPVREKLLSGEQTGSKEWDRLETSRRRVVAWFAPSSVQSDLSLLALTRAQYADSATAKLFLEQSEKWQRAGLSGAPADAYGWFRMAYLFYRAEGASEAAARAWTLSLAAAPYEPRLSLARLEMAVRLGPRLDEEAGRHIPFLIRDAAANDPEGLAESAYKGFYVSLVEQALADDAERLGAFRQQIAEKKQKKIK